jgi:hypothetical protein
VSSFKSGSLKSDLMPHTAYRFDLNGNLILVIGSDLAIDIRGYPFGLATLHKRPWTF